MTNRVGPASLAIENLPREAMSLDHARFKIDLPELLDRHDMIWGEPEGPPADWRAGAPIGNGDFGAMVYGYPEAIGFVLGKSDVWNRQNDDRSQYIGKTFDAYRQTFFDDDEAEFERLREKTKTGYCEQLPHLTTCGRFVVHVDEGAMIANCTLRTHLQQGLASLNWHSPQTKVQLRTLVSREFEVLYIEITCQSQLADDRTPNEVNWEMFRPRLPDNPAPQATNRGDICLLTQRFAAGGRYSIAMTALDGACTPIALDSRVVGNLSPDGRGNGGLILTIVSSEDADDTEAEACRRLERAKQAGSKPSSTNTNGGGGSTGCEVWRVLAISR